MLFEKIETLVKEGKLTISGQHKTNILYELNNDKEDFLERVERSLKWHSFLDEDTRVFNDIYCFDCGEHLKYNLLGDTLVPNASTCFADTIATFDIKAPSGVLMFDDWFEGANDLIGHLDKKSLDINCAKVTVQRTKDYAEENVGHFFVGNSSPHIYVNENNILFSKPSYDEEDNETLMDPNLKEKGYVCTDLWWVSVVDKAVYEKMAKDKFGEEKGQEILENAVENSDAVLNVDPGTYRLTYFIKREDEKPYATLEKIS